VAVVYRELAPPPVADGARWDYNAHAAAVTPV
jgi:hypothetical protein